VVFFPFGFYFGILLKREKSERLRSRTRIAQDAVAVAAPSGPTGSSAFESTIRPW